MKKKNEKRGNFKIEDLVSIPLIGFEDVSFKKDKLAFYWNKSGRFELYIMDLDSKEISQITNGELPKGVRAGFLWGRNDNIIYFTKDKDGDEKHNIYSIDIETKECTQLTNTPDSEEHPLDTSPDGKWLLFAANRNKGQMNLYRLHLETYEVEQITDHKNPVMSACYSTDGTRITYVANDESDYQNRDIYVCSSDGSKSERVVQLKVGSKEFISDWSSDDTFITFTTDTNGNNQVGVYNFDTNEVKLFGDGTSVENAVKVISDEKILCLLSDHASQTPFTYDINTGEKHVFEFPKGIARGSQLINDKEIIVHLNRPISPSTIVRYNMETGVRTTLLETEMRNIDSSLFVDAEYISYPSTNEATIHAIVYKPRDFNPDVKHPAIMIPHGGPTWHYSLSFVPQVQYLTDLGYVVMLPNVRGSTGYGSEFRDACIKDWGGKDHDDWIAGRKWLIEHASVDENKVVLYGGSYGGYATLWCLGNSPELWAAGAAFVPVTDLQSMYEESMEHYKFILRLYMGDPIEDKELWIDRSPLTHIHNLNAPLLLVHGKNDPRCPVSQSRQVVAKLKEHGFIEGKQFEYVEFDVGHGAGGDISGTIQQMKLLDDFLYRNVEMK